MQSVDTRQKTVSEVRDIYTAVLKNLLYAEEVARRGVHGCAPGNFFCTQLTHRHERSVVLLREKLDVEYIYGLQEVSTSPHAMYSKLGMFMIITPKRFKEVKELDVEAEAVGGALRRRASRRRRRGVCGVCSCTLRT